MAKLNVQSINEDCVQEFYFDGLENGTVFHIIANNNQYLDPKHVYISCQDRDFVQKAFNLSTGTVSGLLPHTQVVPCSRFELKVSPHPFVVTHEQKEKDETNEYRKDFKPLEVFTLDGKYQIGTSSNEMNTLDLQDFHLHFVSKNRIVCGVESVSMNVVFPY